MVMAMAMAMVHPLTSAQALARAEGLAIRVRCSRYNANLTHIYDG